MHTLRQFCLFTYPPRSKWASSEETIFFFFWSKSASSVSWSQAHLTAKTHWMVNWSIPEAIELCIASYQGLYAKFVSMMSPKSSIAENDGELMLMALHTHFLPQQQYSWNSFIDENASFFHFFHKITNIWSWRCFSSFQILTQFSHTFCNITMIFKVMSQYFPAFFKRVHNHIRLADG